MSAILTFTDTRSRSTDCDTSRAAAKAAVSHIADQQRAVITATVKASSGMTAREVSVWTGIDYYSVQRRIGECGLTKTTESRDGCRVWSASA